jgi:hypothetical protein
MLSTGLALFSGVGAGLEVLGAVAVSIWLGTTFLPASASLQ